MDIDANIIEFKKESVELWNLGIIGSMNIMQTPSPLSVF